MPKTLTEFSRTKNPDAALVCLTAYTVPMARALGAYVDLLLVGDSVGTVLYGMDNTTGVSLEMMIAHGRAVAKAGTGVPVIVDMPYGTYEDGVEVALANAKRIIEETGADGVKLEGPYAAQIKAIVAAGIPVMGHIGLQPQSVVIEGGYKIKGKSDEDTQRLVSEAAMLAEAGAFSFVLEGTRAAAAEIISKSVPITCIGIGASPECDGQILVAEDLLGLHYGHRAKFVSEYAVLREDIERAAERYAKDVRARAFPREENLYK